jgi:hypothetical protein
MFRKIRILLLLLILATVALGAWRANARLTAWQNSVHVALYPIAADDSPATARYIAQLDADAVAEIGEWLQEEARRYGKTVLQPVVVRLAPAPASQPPLPPQRPGAFDAIVWSLKLRWWAMRLDDIPGPRPQVRLFVLYHDPERSPALPHSTGLNKGQLGLIHAFASRPQHRQNAVIIAHELLHVFGASDKYDLSTSQPLHPDGYAEPDRSPLLPQEFAEIMGGRIPLAVSRSEIPASLGETLIGPATAREIGLLGR